MARQIVDPPVADLAFPPGSSEQDLAAILDGLVQNVGLLLEVPACSVALLDPESGDLVTWSALNTGPDGPRHTRFRPNEGIAGWVAAHQSSLVVNDAANDPRFKPLGGTRIGSVLCVPLMEGKRVLGTLTATSPTTHAFDERSELLLRVFADQAVLAITKARQAREAQAQAAELATLLEAARALTSSLDTQQFFNQIVASIRHVAACDDAVIYALDEPANSLSVVAGIGRRVERLGGLRVSLSDPASIAAWVANNRAPRLVSPGRTPTGQVTETFLAGDPLALLSVPLISKDRLRGVITLARPFAFTPAELRTMSDLATIVAAALENVELYQTARAEREQLAAIFAAGSDGIAIADGALTIVEANEAFARLMNLPLDQIKGQNCCALFNVGGVECGLCNGGDCLIAQALASGEAVPHVECAVRAPLPTRPEDPAVAYPERQPQTSRPLSSQPQTRFIDMSITPVNAPQGRRALLIGRDVTAIHEMETMKANFLGMVSHELRSPLQAINGFLDVLLSGMTGPLAAEQLKFLRRARAGSEHLTALVDDLLLISRTDAGQFLLSYELVDLERLLVEAHEEIELIAAEAGVSVAVRRQPDLPAIPADGPRLRQVLRNLLTNAVKFTPKGGFVTLQATYDAEQVRLSVSDTGIGIAPEHLPRIFDRFYQVHSANARGRGQGLGLAIARIIVEGHAGRIDVDSKPGRGSTFTVILPRYQARATAPANGK
jgi:signal transduction histidine kinase/GAF domain-containing protein